MKVFRRLIILTGILLLLCQVPFSCAQRGMPGGGPIDSLPPVVLKTKPANFTTRFKDKTIRIDFDEYIKLKDPATQILISPPMEIKPSIRPQGQAMKYIEIELRDSLQPNTTYTINFGQSIEDNNEGNALPFYKYVFSTGDYIDSLKVSGSVKDAFKRETKDQLTVLLYKLDEQYSDSVIYQKPPTYIAYTRDSTHTYEFENIAEGSYRIAALNDKNQNYKFDPKTDKIGFLSDTIHIPTDERYDFSVFREKNKFRTVKVTQESLRQLLFAFEGGAEEAAVKMISEKPAGFKEIHYKREQKDSIIYWFQPYFEADSLVFEITKGEIKDTLITRLKEIERDSLRIKAEPTSGFGLRDRFALSANTPLAEIHPELFSIRNKDSIKVAFTTDFKKEINKIYIDFEVREKESYSFQALPGAIKDFFGKENDTLNYKLNTKAETDYADVRITFGNIRQYPVIVQMTNEKGETKREQIHQEEDGNVFDFPFVDPGSYYIRLIYDENDNGKWDTGNYLKQQQPEEVIYMKKPLEVRKNWEISQRYDL